MNRLREFSALGVSFVAHLMLLIVLYVLKMTVIDPAMQADLETVFEPEREQEQITKTLEVNTEVAETFNTIPGGVVTGNIGASTAPVVTNQKVEQSETLQEPTIQVSLSEVTLPSDDVLGKDFGEAEITGEVGAAVEGYGAALSRITQELARMMRKEKVMAVWLFDESGSMKDDQKEIAENFYKVYDELGILTQKDKELRGKSKRGDELLKSVILSFGQGIHEQTPRPTANIEEIKEAIHKIPEDTTGTENMCQSILKTLSDYSGAARRERRRMVLIVVSDESGDDGDNAEVLETTVAGLVKNRVPAYFLGRESMFGYPYARIRWIDPKYKLSHWLQVRRGPETPMVECLQWDGLHSRWDTQPAGFGPYAQVRMARESGGIFFILPGEEENLVNARAIERRKYAFLDMKEYLPCLESRREYILERDGSDFRETIFDVISRLNPHQHKELSIREHWYPMDINEFRAEATGQFNKAVFAMSLLNQAIPLLDKIRPLRDIEASQRWRANYDLAYAQLHAFRIRLFQYMLAMDDHMANNPPPKKQNSNRWNLVRVPRMIEPDERQYGQLKKFFRLTTTREEYLAEVQDRVDEATQLLQGVVLNHPNTPWADRAAYEMKIGFGIEFRDVRRDPRYDNKDIKVPKL